MSAVHTIETLPLGKHPAKHDHRRLHLATYFQAPMGEPLPAVMWSKRVTNLGEMRNDRIGLCTAAAAAHMEQVWTANAGTQVIIPDDGVEQAYIDVTAAEGAAYNPQTGANDNGCALPDMLEYWRLKGIGGRRIQAWADIEPANTRLIKQCVGWFGGGYVGVALPLTALDQLNAGQPWTLAHRFGPRAQPYSWGGHCVELVDYDPDWITFISWGRLIKASWAWFLEYCDEFAAVLSPTSWIGKGGVTPSGLAIDALSRDLDSVGMVHTEVVSKAMYHGIDAAQVVSLWKQYGPSAVTIISQMLDWILAGRKQNGESPRAMMSRPERFAESGDPWEAVAELQRHEPRRRR